MAVENQMKVPGGTIVFVPDEVAPISPAVIPTPTPTPLSQPKSPVDTALTNMTLENYTLQNGIYVADLGGKQAASLQMRIPNMDYGKTVTLEFTRAANYPLVGNIKMMRVWAGGVGNYPNWYAGQQVDGGTILYTEKLDPVTGKTRFYFNYPAPTGFFRDEVWEWKTPSGIGKADGTINLYVEGKRILSTNTWQMTDANNSALPDYLCIQDVIANATFPAGTWAKVNPASISLTVS